MRLPAPRLVGRYDVTHPPHVLVVGGGITGLAAAYRLSRQEGALNVTLVESEQRLGGKVGTERVEGFLIERGPDSLMTAKPHALRLAEELEVELVPARPAGSPSLLHGDRLQPLPDGISGFMPRRALPLARTRLFSPLGKCRMALELLVPPRTNRDDESLEQFTTRRLGRQVYERLVEPVAAGIFSGDPSRLSVLATMPHLRAAEARHGGLIRAMLAEQRAARRSPLASSAGVPRPPVVAPAAGMGALVEALALRLAASGTVDVRLGTRFHAVRPAHGRYEVTLSCAGTTETLIVDGLVLAAPATVAAVILRELDNDEAAEALLEIPQVSTATVTLGYRTEDVTAMAGRLPGHGYLVADGRVGLARAVTWSSAKFPGRAPAGHELLRVSVGGARRPRVAALRDHEVVAAAQLELGQTLGIVAEPVVTVVHRWTRVMPQYEVGHLDRVARIERSLQSHPSVVMAGSALHGLGVPDCIASGERAAEAVSAQLKALGHQA